MLRIRQLGIIAALAAMGASFPAMAQEQLKLEYDALGRLTKVQTETGPNNGTEAVYGYDAAGNRTNVTTSGARKRVVVVPLNGFTIIPLN
jgi:YD repeat-containing protein